MKPEINQQRVEQLFLAAQSRPPEERPAFLDKACAGDAALQAEVESLLACDEQPHRLLEHSAIHADVHAALEDALKTGTSPMSTKELQVELHPERIGFYNILETLGEGGMGTVYLAEQTEPIRRRVALKVIKLGMDTREVIARFESERQTLALMNHPNVARVLDAGATEQGRPYFVMEHVPGIQITRYCDMHRLDTARRLELFMQVCQGIQHAHQKGIIHRDIKPSNILVPVEGEDAVPKIIDFGVAKATQQDLTERSLFTERGQLVGTPEYMSPEQAEMTALDIDTRSDVYALGVLLYELLVGSLPLDSQALRRASFGEIQRIIRDVEPPKPSTRLGSLTDDDSSTVAEKRRSDRAALRRQLRGDLDWITLKALDKDRTRRYAAASELADDIRRHLRHQPVVARPPSAAYLARKFLRRNRLLVGGVSAVFVVLVLGIIGTGLGFRQASKAGRLARNRLRDVEVVARFQGDVLNTIDPEQFGRSLAAGFRGRVEESLLASGKSPEQVEDALQEFDALLAGVNSTDLGRDLLDENILHRAGETIAREFGDQPLIEARLQATLGAIYRTIGSYEHSEPHLLRSLELYREHLGTSDIETLRAMNNLARLHHQQARYDDAEKLYLQTLEIRERDAGADDPDALDFANNLGLLYFRQGRYADARPLFERVLDVRRRALGNEHPRTLSSITNLALLNHYEGRYEEAGELYREALAAHQREPGNPDPEALNLMNNLALLYFRQGRYTDAEPLYRQVLDARERLLGEEHSHTLSSVNNLALLYHYQGRLEMAEPLYRRAIDTYQRLLGEDHPDALYPMNNLGLIYMDQGRYEEAEPLFVKALDIRVRALGKQHPLTLSSMSNLALLHKHLERYVQAERLCAEAVDLYASVLGEDHPDSLIAMESLALVYIDQERHADAEPLLRRVLELRTRVLGEDHPDTLNTMANLGELLCDTDRPDEALPLLATAARRSRDSQAAPSARGVLLRQYGACLTSQQHWDEAETALLEAHDLLQEGAGPAHENTLETVHALVALYESGGKPSESARWRKHLAGLEAAPGDR